MRPALIGLLLAATLAGCHPSSGAPSPKSQASSSPASGAAGVGVFRFSPRPNHAADIHWQAWSGSAFDEARAQKKPVLLSLAAVWCHWCHVLDETTLSDPRVIALLNREFITLRVDADQRPDVEQRYLLGGWPTLAFLDDAGEIIDGGTYVPPDQLLSMAQQALVTYRAGDKDTARRGHAQDPTRPGSLDAVVEGTVRALEQAADLQYGGLGHGQKFPNGEAVRLLVDAGEVELARKTLDGMLRLEDPVEGGFYRYALRPDFTNPHYEKMLYVQADLVAAYASASLRLHEPRYAEAARRTVAYLRKNLVAGDGSFYASQDADEKYSQADAAGRRALSPPYIDRTLLVDRNGRMIEALVVAAEALDDPSLLDDAARAAAVLLSLRDEKGAFFHARRFAAAGATPPPAELSGLLADQALASLALAEVARARHAPTGELMRAAEGAMKAAAQSLADPRGGFFDLPERGAGEGRLRQREKVLDANVAMARAQLAVGDRAGATRTLAAFAGSYSLFGTEAAAYARAVAAATATPAAAP